MVCLPLSELAFSTIARLFSWSVEDAGLGPGSDPNSGNTGSERNDHPCLDTLAQACNPGYLEAEAGGLLRV